jgi:signal transduction histidine kinase
MAVEGQERVHVVVHCRRRRDAALVEGLLGELGAGWSPLGSFDEVGRLLADDGVDLALADVEADGRLDGLVRHLSRANGEAPPLILLAHPRRLSVSLRRVAQRFHVSVLHRPFGKPQLAQAIHHGLKIRSHQRGGRRLRAQLARAEAQVERLKQEAEEDVRRRNKLLASISHNLRTPVNEIVLFCQVVRGAAGTPEGLAEVEGLATDLLTSVASLRELVDDLLDIARFDLDLLEFRPSIFPLIPFLDRTLSLARTLAASKGLAFHVAAEPAGLIVRTDPNPLARVLQNLASNAVKFTDGGEVHVSARVARTGELILAVRDTGRGIAADDQVDIFDEFAQLDNPEGDRTKGTGLGLAICRRLVAALGGRIEVVSALGSGSTFTATLPADAVVTPRFSHRARTSR